MLLEMYISNFVLIEEQRLDFTAGLNVLTGETGAGKSIIIDALGLLLGERIKNDYIRDVNKKAVIEAVFDLNSNQETLAFLQEQELLMADDANLIISREILPNGRNTARINGRNVNINTLKTLGDTLVDMQLQNDRYAFLHPLRYLAYVDGFTEQTEALLEGVTKLYLKAKDLQEQIQVLISDQKLRTQKLDFLEYQIKEIEDSRLQEGEEEELAALRARIRNAGSFLEGSNRMMALLYNAEQTASAYDQIAAALDIAIDHKEDQFFAECIEPLENMTYVLQDLSRKLSSFQDTLEFEPGLLESVEERLYLIAKMKKKYGASIPDILEFLAKARCEYEALANSDELLEAMQQELNNIQDEYRQLASALTAKRQAAASRLEESVKQQLMGLNMPHIRFQIEISQKSQPGPKGMDEIEFLFSSNPGEEMRAISRIASGGEVSRFILALKIALANVYQVPTLIFDEIDTGIGGTALSAMAQKIAELAADHQVILVTHSPQLASYAQQHLLIDKYVAKERTFTSVKSLDQEERIKELARMLDGENYSALTLQHAREMLALRK